MRSLEQATSAATTVDLLAVVVLAWTVGAEQPVLEEIPTPIVLNWKSCSMEFHQN